MKGGKVWPGALGAALGILAAAPALFCLRGFTVDDALIPARYAAHLAHGEGYRFNAGGPSTDGVTPLGFALVLAPFAGRGALAALGAARFLGGAAWIAAAALLGARIASISAARVRYAALFIVLFSAPLGAWAVAGLETGLVVALATVAAAWPSDGRRSAMISAGAAGIAAAWRPEMLPWAAILAFGRSRELGERRDRVAAWALAVGPWCAVVALRIAFFGRPAPLAVLAKPSDLAHGVTYVAWNFAYTGAPLAALGIGVWRRLDAWPRTLAVAALVHLVVVALAGGDWMPLARLLTPILPSLVVVVAHQLAASPAPSVARLALGCAAEALLFYLRGPEAAHVLADRSALIDAARAPLAGAERVATVDVGWVGAATDAEIVDLAGATDVDIAALPGGHTSKAVSAAMLAQRNPDRLVFQLAPNAETLDTAPAYARFVERALGGDPAIRRAYREIWRSPKELPVHYVILSRPGDAPHTMTDAPHDAE
jgi:hypothetical protein